MFYRRRELARRLGMSFAVGRLLGLYDLGLKDAQERNVEGMLPGLSLDSDRVDVCSRKQLWAKAAPQWLSPYSLLYFRRAE